MSDETQKILDEQNEYKYGFVTDIESEDFPTGLSEEIVRELSRRKKEPEWLTDFRVKSFNHWKTLKHPKWQHLKFNDVNFDEITYYAAPKLKKPKYQSLDEVDDEILKTFATTAQVIKKTKQST